VDNNNVEKTNEDEVLKASVPSVCLIENDVNVFNAMSGRRYGNSTVDHRHILFV
jgi:hypothetical protein